MQVTGVDDAGVRLRSSEQGGADADVPVDVLFDGRRIWSFWTRRDTVEDAGGLLAQWPKQLRKYLHGHSQVTVMEHVSKVVLHDAEVTLGNGKGKIAVVDAAGRPLGIDKSNRITTTFDTRSPEHTKPLLDAMERLLADIHEAGVEAFPAYGTLLGAVREGQLIGHDSDVDLGYVSRHEHPVDVVRESFRLQRFLRDKGYPVDRYSGAAFKVDAIEADGSRRGMDVFGGFFSEGRLYLLGEIGDPFEREWIFPLGTCELEGRTLPAPAQPERLLEATYGPDWRVPDPAFHFETPRATVRRLNGWFRGIRIFRNDWDRRYSSRPDVLPSLEPSSLARHIVEREGVPARVVDVGAGRAADALWFARQGSAVTALDYAPRSGRAVQHAATEKGVDLEVRWMNLHETRSVLANGALVAHQGGAPVLMARHLLDATNAAGRTAFIRFARMALSGGGRLYTEFFHTGPGVRETRGKDFLAPVDTDLVVAELQAAGADIVARDEMTAPGDSGRPKVRLVAEWRT